MIEERYIIYQYSGVDCIEEFSIEEILKFLVSDGDIIYYDLIDEIVGYEYDPSHQDYSDPYGYRELKSIIGKINIHGYINNLDDKFWKERVKDLIVNKIIKNNNQIKLLIDESEVTLNKDK